MPDTPSPTSTPPDSPVASAPQSPHSSQSPPWRSALVDVLLLVALVGGIYFTRLPALPCSLDEPQWATVSRGMIATGDWVVPRLGSVLCADRPPAHEWLIAGSMLALRTTDMTAPRLPSALATLLTALLIYALSRTLLTHGGALAVRTGALAVRYGALASAAAYATMWETMAKGSTADSEAVYTLFVTASLFAWILGYARKWHPAATWCAGYFFAALAMLTKGLQGPYFFVAAVLLFLALRRDWRYLFSRWHALGIAVFAAAVGAWLIPFWMRTDTLAVKMIFTGIIDERFAHTGAGTVLKHLAIYPFDVLGMMLPWSLVLPLYALRGVRRAVIPRPSAAAAFLLAAIAAGFIPMWIAPGAHGRYTMPLFACAAPFIGLALEKLMRPAETGRIHLFNKVSRIASLAAILGAGAAILAVSCFSPTSRLAQPAAFAAVYFLAAVAIAAVLLRAARQPAGLCARLSVAAIAAFIGLSFTGVRTNQYVRYKVDVQAAVEAAKKQLPIDAPLTCFGYLHPVFAYYFNGPINVQPWPERTADVPRGVEYFCFCGDLHPGAQLPFAWTKLSEVPCDRGTLTPSNRSVIIGKRTDAAGVALAP